MSISPERDLEPVAVRLAELRPVLSQPDNPLCAAILEEVGGGRRIGIVMRKPEADHIAMYLQNAPTQRPMTYSFMASLLPALGGRLVETRITWTDGRTVYAVAVADGLLGRRTLDVRPSDGINLALRLGAPIRVDPDALVALGVPHTDGQPDTPPVEWV